MAADRGDGWHSLTRLPDTVRAAGTRTELLADLREHLDAALPAEADGPWVLVVGVGVLVLIVLGTR